MKKKERKHMKKVVRAMVNGINEILNKGVDETSPALIKQWLKLIKFFRKL